MDHFFTHDQQFKEWLKYYHIIDNTEMDSVSIYHRLHQFLLVDALHPREVILDAVNQFKQSVQWDNYTVFGMHIRTGLLEGNIGWGRFLEEEDIQYFISEALRITTQRQKIDTSKPVKWLVLVDSKAVKRKVSKALGDQVIVSNCTVHHSKYLDSHAMFCSFVENYLLSDCKFLMLTFKSTYGYLARYRTDVNQINVLPGTWRRKQNKEQM